MEWWFFEQYGNEGHTGTFFIFLLNFCPVFLHAFTFPTILFLFSFPRPPTYLILIPLFSQIYVLFYLISFPLLIAFFSPDLENWAFYALHAILRGLKWCGKIPICSCIYGFIPVVMTVHNLQQTACRCHSYGWHWFLGYGTTDALPTAYLVMCCVLSSRMGTCSW
jgi:hypothetical protein